MEYFHLLFAVFDQRCRVKTKSCVRKTNCGHSFSVPCFLSYQGKDFRVEEEDDQATSMPKFDGRKFVQHQMVKFDCS
ncbi:hypothetical protein C4D60_Mb09t17170 [Musa balbisiana]|uniref:Uncharacterized protein n=1 Tax=Musa balbisiana TaxID=52838 RepID=A0A4S8IH10_MUSBA|nr:hypothetical protein C4D60_Mb09t17170 [Musa balbisiana]